jgi:hypothetical protein
VPTDLGPIRQVALGAAWLLFVVGICVALNATTGSTRVAPPLTGSALPPDVAGNPPDGRTYPRPPSSVIIHHSPTTATAQARGQRTGIPVAIDVPFPSSHYPRGLHASVTANLLNTDGTLFVPADPRVVSWARQDAAPGSDRGTIVFTSHVNYVIDGRTVVGALADLAEYARTAVGKEFSLRLADGHNLKYRVEAGREYHKGDLAADRSLRAKLYDQTSTYGAPGKPPTSRLLLVSCGGAFDNSTGEYEDNVFLYALPVV